MMNDEYYMRLALNEAKKAYDEDEVPIGAVIVNDKTGEVISFAHNSVQKEKKVTFHAEINAINKASEYFGGHRLNDCSLYVTLEPCPMCAGACVMSGISRVVFAAKDEKNGAVISNDNIFDKDFTNKVLYNYGVSENKSKELLRNFFKEKRDNKLSVTFSVPETEYQKNKFYDISGTYPDEKSLFVRKNGKIAGAITFCESIPKVFVTKEYSAYLTEKEVLDAYGKK